MKKISVVSLMLLASSSLSFAAGENVAGVTTDSGIITVGPSIATRTHGLAGQPGLGVYSIAGGAPIAAKVLYETLRTSFDPQTGIATIGGPAHPGMGTWALGRVVGKDSNEVYYGTWVGQDPRRTQEWPTNADYAVAASVTRSLNSVKGNSYTYATKGIDDNANLYRGNLTATFNSSGTGGRLAGSIASDNHTVAIDGTGAVIGIVNAEARFRGTANAGGYKVDGRFYGANAETLAGIAKYRDDSEYSVSFAGVR